MPDDETKIETPAFRYFPYRDRNPVSGHHKIRWIGAPNRPMRLVHARIIRRIRQLPVDRSVVTGMLPGCSPVNNVLLHRHHQFFYLIDLHSAYRQVDRQRLIELLTGLVPENDAEAIGIFLDRFCLDPRGGLVTGAPASPDLFNFYAARLIDERLIELCWQHGITYTRYLDDLTFSSDVVIGCRIRRQIRDIIVAAGLPIQHRKCQVIDILKRPVIITGVGLDKGGRLFLPRHYLRRIRGLLHVATYRGSVPADIVEGTMGAFKAITHGQHPRHIEMKIRRQYEQYRQRLTVG